ncbi:hypothetical protein [Pusillimonas sp. ANT_WB101]|uniref:hypothetical protein n=1 Tax=Pusillimonas sp. ANT_WB101 TaxID=2597356 RepID=UPI0011EC441E|nr:hypothetical protein [Pusillimonas sp. ANT_WB101]KAA0890022.1 hypothetical protein FQ179_16895 [Pusillimonas sp. ANT_WB101]
MANIAYDKLAAVGGASVGMVTPGAVVNPVGSRLAHMAKAFVVAVNKTDRAAARYMGELALARNGSRYSHA